MKKTLTLVLSLIIMSACAAPDTNRDGAVATNRNANAGTDAAPAITEADAIAKETAIWDTIKRKDYDAFANMLADDQMEVLSDGVKDKAGSVAGVKEFEPSETTFSDWKFLPIDKDAFILIYTVAVKGKFRGEEFAPQTARSSSAWVNRNNKWVAVYHQECPVAKASPSPAKPATDAKPATSPVATATTGTTGPDPIANEKLVWDLFKNKNYDAFAALLAPEFLEAAPDKVYDKAEAVKGVSMFDASKAVISEWKTLKFDNDAALVVYTVNIPGGPAQGERHSTIWVDRGGKWLGLFHHGGTPVEKLPPPPPPKPSASPSTK